MTQNKNFKRQIRQTDKTDYHLHQGSWDKTEFLSDRKQIFFCASIYVFCRLKTLFCPRTPDVNDNRFCRFVVFGA